MDPKPQPILPREFAMAVYILTSVILVVLLIVHVTGAWNWHIDVTAFALIGVLLVIPVAERLRKFKIGKYVEAEFEEMKAEVERLEVEFSGLRDITLSPDEASVAAAAVEAQADAVGASEQRAGLPAERTIEQIVWVDDQPANNRLEIAELRRRFTVLTAMTTQAGLDAIVTPEKTAVITDAVRDEDGATNVDAGVNLLSELQARHPGTPAYVFCSQKTVDEQLDSFTAVGARLVTASFTELAERIRVDARISFEAEVAATLERHGSVKGQTAGVDFVLEHDSRRIGVEAKDFRRTPKATAFDAAVGRLAEAIEKEKIDEGLLVAPRDVFVGKQRSRTPEGIRLLTTDELPETL